MVTKKKTTVTKGYTIVTKEKLREHTVKNYGG